MAIRELKEGPPHNLPPALLFLDDIETIVEIFEEAFEEFPIEQPGDILRVQYQVKLADKFKECDSLEDLKKLGGKTSHFRVLVGYVGVGKTGIEVRAGYVSFAPWGTEWSLVDEESTAGWRVYGRLLELFKTRRKWWIISKDSIFANLLGSGIFAFIALIVSVLAFLNILRESVALVGSSNVITAITPIIVLLLVFVLPVSFVLGLTLNKSKSTVVFRYSYEGVKTRERILKAARSILVPFLAGFLGFIGGYLARKLLP